jgi:hypothetical protein
VTLELGNFVTSGGRDLGWIARLSETTFTLHPCDEHTVLLEVGIKCDTATPGNNPNQPPDNRIDVLPGGTVDRCEVGYATIRAEGCLTRPIVVAIAVLPDDCDSYHHSCGCDCCR